MRCRRTKIREWLAESYEELTTNGVTGAVESLYLAYIGAMLSAGSSPPVGTTIYDLEWDLLIVLDACRVDALRAVTSEYEFLNEIESYWSVGSQSAEWMANTFTQANIDDIAATKYVSGNIYTELLLEDRRFPPDDELMPPNERVVPVVYRNWKTVDKTDFDDVITTHGREQSDNNSVPPRPITDAVIQECRAGNPDRTIAHYMQPHEPYIGADHYSEPGELQRLSSGELSKSDLWTAYLENLRFVLDEVALLVDNVDAERVVITADHGEAFGEWRSVGHTICFPHPVVRKVPLAETTAVDKQTHEPEEYEGVESENSQRGLLRNLGYL